MPSQKASLACTECGSRNYSVTLSKGRVERLGVNKFCPYCGKHTFHRETK